MQAAQERAGVDRVSRSADSDANKLLGFLGALQRKYNFVAPGHTVTVRALACGYQSCLAIVSQHAVLSAFAMVWLCRSLGLLLILRYI